VTVGAAASARASTSSDLALVVSLSITIDLVARESSLGARGLRFTTSAT
jgi:hypothetical protein